jgi:hypothetical protein
MVVGATADVSVQSAIPRLLVEGEPVAAASPQPLQTSPAPEKDPFKRLFVVPPAQDGGAQPDARLTGGQPRVVCGMTLVPAKPEVDPKMVRPREPEPNREYKIRTISPRICRE